MKRYAPIAILAVLLAAPAVASAQGGPGFLFKRPSVAIAVRAGYVLPGGGGQLFDYVLDEFIPLGADTLSSWSFDSPYLGGEFAVRPWERWDVVAAVGWTRSRRITEYRDYVEDVSPTVSVPIEQETTFEVVTATVGTRYYLQDRGRRVSTLAWVPSRFAPFVGTGVGVSWYSFAQQGDFLDTGTLVISSDYLESRSQGFSWYANGGMDVTLGKNVLLTGELRYSLSKAAVKESYVGFDNIDLGGVHFLVGLGFQF
jgi:hypothetical protein